MSRHQAKIDYAGYTATQWAKASVVFASTTALLFTKLGRGCLMRRRTYQAHRQPRQRLMILP